MKVIEFDESDNIVKPKKKKDVQIEMTNLRELREFVPMGTVNKSKKKREKRLRQKQQEREAQAAAEAKRLAEEEAKARAALKKGEKAKIVSSDGKVLKKKTMPKKKVVDDRGEEWEIVDNRKT